MIRKILILALVTLSAAICGCDQNLPNVPNKGKLTVQQETPTPPAEIEKPVPPQPAQNIQEPEPSTVVSPAIQDKPQKLKVKVYYPDDAGINLVAVNRTVEIKNDSEKYLAAVKLLIKNPDEKDLTVIFPKNAKINSVTFDNGTATVDFDKNIKKSFTGGSTGEELLVNSVVKTLTEFPEVQQVRFLVDGKEIETLAGHMDLSAPVKKTDL